MPVVIVISMGEGLIDSVASGTMAGTVEDVSLFRQRCDDTKAGSDTSLP
jgi:hypothetical protein